MKPKIAAEWIEAHKYCEKNKSVPSVLAQEAAKRFKQAMRKAIPAKEPIRFPRGSKPKSMKALKKAAWDAFSRFIRQRDADESGHAKCITCDSIRHWTGMDAGHFISRVYESTLFDEQNVHASCKFCNMPPNNGRPIEYAAYLDNRYGPGTAAKITARAYRRTLKREELEMILKKYSGPQAPEGSK